jgi:DNA topoisomerase-2
MTKVVKRKNTEDGGVDDGGVSSKYVKLSQREHVLVRPDMYIGKIESDENCSTWIRKGEEMKYEQIDYIPGLYKIFDEIIVNSIDHVTRMSQAGDGVDVVSVKNIKVEIDKETGIISVFNDGNGIEVLVHNEKIDGEDIYIPELIFGNMLTSSNFNDQETERIIGGLNGIGAKACNIFSTRFEIETVDHIRKKCYKQTFYDNMSRKDKPKITSCSKKPYTKFTFLPDYSKFKLKALDNDMYNLFCKRVYDACAMTPQSVNVFLNTEKLKVKTFEQYANLFYNGVESVKIGEKQGDRWEYIVVYDPSFKNFSSVSFVNGIATIRGGKHVSCVLDQIVKKLSEVITKRHKVKISIPTNSIKNKLCLFVKSVISNPTFDSQSKETLTTNVSKFGSKVEVSDKFIEKLYKSGIVDNIIQELAHLQEKTASKTDGKKKKNIRGIANFEDAHYAGSKRSTECTLIVTEGLSAATFAISGLAVVGRDLYGVFPIKGKMLNVKDASVSKISENLEITNLKKILGLENGKEYNDLTDLRYGKIMILSDQDRDGSHIKGLIFNLFHTLWPSLLEKHSFLISMLTPIVKVTLGKKIVDFYSLQDFFNWKNKEENLAKWTIKYYKGLGTSTSSDAKGYFKQMKNVNYKWNQKSNDALNLAFDKNKSLDRKEWLSNYDKQALLDYASKNVTFEDFVHKDLIHFSKYDVERSIPSLVDGLKISQRKILYACFKKNLTTEIKVAQLAGYVSEHTDYLHGEASLQGAIVGMAQDYVGSNNVNYLIPNGSFGTRYVGGKDASQPRYIFTYLSPIVKNIFQPMDNPILHYLCDEGNFVEPEFYVPIIPMILVNGAIGIGTGFSTNIPSYNPKDIMQVLYKLLSGISVESDELVPWYKGYKGLITKKDDKFYSQGVFKQVSSDTIKITELPIGTWTSDYKTFLEDKLDKSELKSVINNSTDIDVDFTISFPSAFDKDTFLEKFKMISNKSLSVSNMYLFNEQGCITKFDSPVDIIKAFYSVRLEYYSIRKKHQLEQLKVEIDLLENKIRFLGYILEKTIDIQNLNKSQLKETLVKHKFSTRNSTFDYLVNIPIYKLSMDNVKELRDSLVSLGLEFEILEKTETSDIWKRELETLGKKL